MYYTSEIAKKVGLHPNTVLWYEQMNYLPPVKRKENGYRMFTDIHLEQLKLIKMAFRCEILQSNLRKKAIEIIQLCARAEYEQALEQAIIYHGAIGAEKAKAEEAVRLVQEYLNLPNYYEPALALKRNETAKYLGITIDTLRNWELNGLLEVPRKENGYRVYTNKEIRDLKIIRALRHANYSLMAILRMLAQLRNSQAPDLRQALDTPCSEEDIVYVTDKLLTSLTSAEVDAKEMMTHIKKIK